MLRVKGANRKQKAVVCVFERCATPFCCCCFDFGLETTCYIIASMCIVINAFMWRANFGIGHVALYIMSVLTYLIYLIAGILLFLGASWERNRLKMAYCWLCLLGMISAVIGLIVALVYYQYSYLIWGRGCHEMFEGADVITMIVHVLWLVLWSIYTPMIVLGNLSEESCCSDDI